MLKLYTGLVRIYDPGDRIYLFGFSRGAFTVRTLAGLIAKCGILDWNRMPTTDAMRAEVAAAYRIYRQGYRTWVWRMLHRKSLEDVQKSAAEAMSKFRLSRYVHDARIHFIGVWDTVDAVGGPFHLSDLINTLFHRFNFPDQKLSDKVDCAVQALSIDDARAAFEPRLWEDHPCVEQVWFSGVHSNVGGAQMVLRQQDYLDFESPYNFLIARESSQTYRQLSEAELPRFRRSARQTAILVALKS